MIEQIKAGSSLLVRGEWNILIKEILRRFYSDETSYLLRRDLEVPIEIPKAKIQISIRELQPKDLAFLFDESEKKLGEEGVKDKVWRQLLLHSNIQKCYVATDESGSACFMQYLIGEEENDKFQPLFEGGFLPLRENEMLLEGAFTPEQARGQGIMAEAMARIANEGKKYSCRYIYTYVRTDNIPSLKGCKKAGFYPYQLRKDKWRVFRRKLEFVQLPANSKMPF